MASQTSKSDPPGETPIRLYIPMIPDTARAPATKQASKKYVNLQLIKSCALLASSEPARALEYVEEALFVAEEKNLFYEISKCYLYRGLCFMALERWMEARVAFVRGVNVRGWGRRVEGLMREAQGHVDEERKLVGKKGKFENEAEQ